MTTKINTTQMMRVVIFACCACDWEVRIPAHEATAGAVDEGKPCPKCQGATTRSSRREPLDADELIRGACPKCEARGRYRAGALAGKTLCVRCGDSVRMNWLDADAGQGADADVEVADADTETSLPDASLDDDFVPLDDDDDSDDDADTDASEADDIIEEMLYEVDDDADTDDDAGQDETAADAAYMGQPLAGESDDELEVVQDEEEDDELIDLDELDEDAGKW